MSWPPSRCRAPLVRRLVIPPRLRALAHPFRAVPRALVRPAQSFRVADASGWPGRGSSRCPRKRAPAAAPCLSCPVPAAMSHSRFLIPSSTKKEGQSNAGKANFIALYCLDHHSNPREHQTHARPEGTAPGRLSGHDGRGKPRAQPFYRPPRAVSDVEPGEADHPRRGAEASVLYA